MKIALPIWNDRISPLFDTSGRVLILDMEKGNAGEWEEHDMQDLITPMKVRRITELGAEVLICGAVSNQVANLVESSGIELVPWVRGPVDEVIAAFQAGQLDRPCYFMPGCGRRRRRRSGSRRRQAFGHAGKGTAKKER